VGRDVRLALVANDVQHSFFVPAFLIKRDLIPGRTNQLVLRAEREGRFLGHCAEFCGFDHARMNFTVRVVPGEEFDRWLATQEPGANG
jgi:cytochrome c oxidase subunit 2